MNLLTKIAPFDRLNIVGHSESSIESDNEKGMTTLFTKSVSCTKGDRER